ncbi:PPR domain-containing protein/PPR_2 domain-containing protein, partial [Cephalotus follicularis]
TSSISLRHLRRLTTTTTVATTTPPTTTTPSISISSAKSKLRTEHDPDKALQIYSSVSKHYSFPASSRYAQDITVKRLAKSRRFADIESLIESHKTDPKITEEPYLSSLIRSYGRAGMFDHALSTFHQMEQLGTPRTVISFNALLSACVLSKLFDKVPDLFKEIPEKNNVMPDKVSYGILVKSYCESVSPDKAIEILKDMEDGNVEVTAVTFTTIYYSLYKKGKIEDAERFWSEMVRKGCQLDVAAYNVRIMNAQDGELDRIRELIDEMGASGLKPDTISYNFLMASYCRRGMLEEAMKVYKGLEDNGLKPNACTFRTLIYYLCRNEEFDKGYKLYKESVRMHKILNFDTMKRLVEGLVKTKKIKLAKELSRTMKKKSSPGVLNLWKKLEVELGLSS